MRLTTLTVDDFATAQKQETLARYHALGLPSKESEAYRYFSTQKLFEKEYEVIDYPTPEIAQGESIKIVDGVVVSAPKGLRIYYEAQMDAVDSEHFDPIYYLGHLLSPRVIRIEIDGDAEIELEHHYTKSHALIHYRIVLSNQANRHATFYERFIAEDISDSLVLYGYDMEIAPDSTLRVIKEQFIAPEAYAIIASHSMKVGRNATLLFKSFDFGGGDGLQLIRMILDHHATADANHLLYLNDSARRGTISTMIHRGEHSRSTQEAKTILDADTRGIFDALIKVESTAKHTKAEQNSKAILLDEKAYMVAKPQLEIDVDELEASHGATTGQLNPEALFYLESRGLSTVEARKMLVLAFANTLIEKVKDIRYQNRIQEAFEMVFYRK